MTTIEIQTIRQIIKDNAANSAKELMKFLKIPFKEASDIFNKYSLELDFNAGDYVYYTDTDGNTSPTVIEKKSQKGRYLIQTFDFRKIWVTDKKLKLQTIDY